MSDDEEFQYTEERPAYGPQGRWTQLRTQRDHAMAEAKRLHAILTRIGTTPYDPDDTFRCQRMAMEAITKAEYKVEYKERRSDERDFELERLRAALSFIANYDVSEDEPAAAVAMRSTACEALT